MLKPLRQQTTPIALALGALIGATTYFLLPSEPHPATGPLIAAIAWLLLLGRGVKGALAPLHTKCVIPGSTGQSGAGALNLHPARSLEPMAILSVSLSPAVYALLTTGLLFTLAQTQIIKAEHAFTPINARFVV